MYIHMYVNMYIHMYVNMYIHMYVNMYIHMYTHVRKHVYTYVYSGVAKVGNGWAQAQPIMSSVQPIFMSIGQPIYAPFHVKIYNK